MLETAGPVAAFTDAVEAHDLDRAAQLLAPDASLVIPPLHHVREGIADILGALGGLLGVFGDLRYEVHSRYLTSHAVTDEVVFAGRQTKSFLGVSPQWQSIAVPARVIFDHDGTGITRITVWPDVAALRAALAGADRVIDLTRADPTSELVASLRATLPARRPRVIVGEAREPQLPPSDPPPAARPVGPVVGPGRAVPKAPVPKSVRRRRAVLGGGTMLITAGALASWVAAGALSLPGSPPASAVPASVVPASVVPGSVVPGSVVSGATSDGSSNPKPSGPGPSTGGLAAPLEPARQLAAGRNTVVIGSDLLFDINSARLTPKARRILADLILQARSSERRGTVTVSGHTDSVGSSAYNLALSKRRAAAVAAELRSGLAGSGMTIVSRGYGEDEPVASNATAKGKEANRRVTVTFPPRTG